MGDKLNVITIVGSLRKGFLQRRARAPIAEVGSPRG